VLAARTSGTLATKPGVQFVNIEHDHWCAIYRGRGCDCVPDISLSSAERHDHRRPRCRSEGGEAIIRVNTSGVLIELVARRTPMTESEIFTALPCLSGGCTDYRADKVRARVGAFYLRSLAGEKLAPPPLSDVQRGCCRLSDQEAGRRSITFFTPS
jgi:hypothetical protein